MIVELDRLCREKVLSRFRNIYRFHKDKQLLLIPILIGFLCSNPILSRSTDQLSVGWRRIILNRKFSNPCPIYPKTLGVLHWRKVWKRKKRFFAVLNTVRICWPSLEKQIRFVKARRLQNQRYQKTVQEIIKRIQGKSLEEIDPLLRTLMENRQCELWCMKILTYKLYKYAGSWNAGLAESKP